jgi:hypothetical protein
MEGSCGFRRNPNCLRKVKSVDTETIILPDQNFSKPMNNVNSYQSNLNSHNEQTRSGGLPGY